MRSVFRKPTALQMAVQELEESKCERLIAAKQREYYCAMEDVLIHRIERLRNTIVELAEEGEKS